MPADALMTQSQSILSLASEELTHWGLGEAYYTSVDWVIIGSGYGLAPSLDLNQWWLTVNWTLTNKFKFESKYMTIDNTSRC